MPFVVSYRNSTSNHNYNTAPSNSLLLYLIEILHQTTTTAGEAAHFSSCILSKFYIKPQHLVVFVYTARSCILSKFYIKPQRLTLNIITSVCCILSKFYIKPQLRLERELARCSCILSKFYIKPQLEDTPDYISRVVSYRNSTSNHNAACTARACNWLYLIEILHQTTTSGLILIDKVLLTGCLPL